MMSEFIGKKQTRSLDVDATAACIARVQRQNGDIPWCPNDKTDPWDMVEAAMGLSIGGYTLEAANAYAWLARHQNLDGSWYTAYRDGCAVDTTRDANLSAYIAVGVLHHYLISNDQGFLKQMWGSVRSAIDFALSLQAPAGEIYWAISPEGSVDRMALLTGSCSIFMSIRCALRVARLLGHRKDTWKKGLHRLQNAIVFQPHRYSRTRDLLDDFGPVGSGPQHAGGNRIQLDDRQTV